MDLNNSITLTQESLLNKMSFGEKIELNSIKICVKIAEKISNLIGRSDILQIGITEQLISKIKHNTSEDFYGSLEGIYLLILDFNLFSVPEYKYIFVQTLLKKCKQINSDNFEAIKGIFKGFEKEFDRAKFFINF